MLIKLSNQQEEVKKETIVSNQIDEINYLSRKGLIIENERKKEIKEFSLTGFLKYYKNKMPRINLLKIKKDDDEGNKKEVESSDDCEYVRKTNEGSFYFKKDC